MQATITAKPDYTVDTKDVLQLHLSSIVGVLRSSWYRFIANKAINHSLLWVAGDGCRVSNDPMGYRVQKVVQ